MSRLRVLLAVVALIAVAPRGGAQAAAASDLDLSFAAGGIARTTIAGASHDRAYAIALQPDGRLVVAGSTEGADGSTDVVVARYLATGSLDATFGSGGLVVDDWSGDFDVANAVAVAADGSIVVGGIANLDFGLARYQPNGAPDTSFGTGGVVVTRFGNSAASGHALVLLADGRIMLAGVVDHSTQSDFALARYTAAGSLDPTFGGDGLVQTSFGSERAAVYAIAEQPDGKLIAAGATEDDLNADFALARYGSDGALDATFGTSGTARADHASDFDYAYALLLQSDGSIVAAGQAGLTDGSSFGLARFRSNGTLDPSFGTSGWATARFDQFFGNQPTDAHVSAIARLGDGFVAAGSAGTDTKQFALARFAATGALDPSFGTGGRAVTGVGAFADEVNAIAVQADRKVVVAGSSYQESTFDLALARYIGDARPPSAPLSLSGTSSGLAAGEIQLAWSAPATSPAGPVLGYRIYRATPTGAWSMIRQLGDVRSFRDAGLLDDTTYRYRVTAVNQAGEGSPSADASVTTRGRPSAPLNLKAVGAEGEIALTWSPPQDPGTRPITSYRIEIGPDEGSFTATVDVTTTSYNHTGLRDVEAHCYRVRAVNSYGPGPASTTACATTRGLPTQPRNLASTRGLRSVGLTWAAPADPGTYPITGYRIYRGSSGTLVGTTGTTGSFTDTGLQDDTGYTYAVSAVNQLGEGPRSQSIVAWTAGPPGRVRDLRSAPGDAIGEVELSWLAPSDDGGTPITGYVIVRSGLQQQSVTFTLAATATSFTDTSALPGIRYSYRVAARNAVGPSPTPASVCAYAYPWLEDLGCP